MAEIVNLRLARKKKSRADKEAAAAANRAAFGRPKHEKDQRAAEAEQASRHLDGHRLTNDDEES